jgi:hypothetical protein
MVSNEDIYKSNIEIIHQIDKISFYVLKNCFHTLFTEMIIMI